MTKFNLNFQKDIAPHLLAVVVFFLITFIFFKPMFLDNKSLNQHDILQWKGGAQELIDYREATGEEGLWSNNMFSGMPAYLVNTQFSGNLLIQVEKVYTLFLGSPAKILFAAFLSFYIMLLCFGVRPYLAIAGALLFGLSTYNTIGFVAGHNARITAVAYIPLVLGGIHLAFQRKWVWGFVLTMIGLGLNLRVNHYQITYYLLLMVMIYGLIWLVFAIREKTMGPYFKTIAILSVAVVIAVGCNIGRMWTIVEYSQYSIRGPGELTSGQENVDADGLDKAYAFEFSNGIFEPLVVFIPNIMGGASNQKLDRDSNLG